MLKPILKHSWLSAILTVGPSAALYISNAQADVGRPIQVAARPSSHCQAPQWSPDGRKLAIDVYNPKVEAREVWVMDLNSQFNVTREEQVLPLGQRASRLNGGKTPPVIEFSWTPDMEMLNPPYVFSSQGMNRKNFDIYADGSWITEANTGNDGQPVFSPDSNYLAYTSQQRESGDIMMIDYTADLDKPVRLTNTPSSTEYLPQWHPTKPKLLFIRSQKSRGQDIVIIDNPKKPQSSTRELTNWKADEIRPQWSPDGRYVAFYSNEKSGSDKVFDLWVIQSDGTQAKRLAKDVIVDDHKGPAWSGDASIIFYVKKDYKRSNPILWTRRDGSKSGLLTSETQINSDLNAHHKADGTTYLAYRSAGLKGSLKKTWQRIFVLKFQMSDLK